MVEPLLMIVKRVTTKASAEGRVNPRVRWWTRILSGVWRSCW